MGRRHQGLGRLTEEQRALVEEYRHLPHWALGRWPYFVRRLGEAEALSHAGYALCVAALRHDPARSKFVTFATKYIRWAWLRTVRLESRVKASSLSEPLGDGGGEFGDTLAAPAAPAPEYGADELAMVEAALGGLPEAQRECLLGLYGAFGREQQQGREVAAARGCSKAAVYDRAEAAVARLRRSPLLNPHVAPDVRPEPAPPLPPEPKPKPGWKLMPCRSCGVELRRRKRANKATCRQCQRARHAAYVREKAARRCA